MPLRQRSKLVRHPGATLKHTFLPRSQVFPTKSAGWVDSIGAGVTSVKEGDAVAVYGPWGCGKCSRCQLGIETLCENPMGAPIPGGGGGLGGDMGAGGMPPPGGEAGGMGGAPGAPGGAAVRRRPRW